MPRATWNGTVLAESDRCLVVEGNQYFPPDALKREYVQSASYCHHAFSLNSGKSPTVTIFSEFVLP